MAVTILMLQTFTVECRATCSGTYQKTARLRITSSPTQIAHSLKTKH
jgi:hypothetical protein